MGLEYKLIDRFPFLIELYWRLYKQKFPLSHALPSPLSPILTVPSQVLIVPTRRLKRICRDAIYYKLTQNVDACSRLESPEWVKKVELHHIVMVPTDRLAMIEDIMTAMYDLFSRKLEPAADPLLDLYDSAPSRPPPPRSTATALEFYNCFVDRLLNIVHGPSFADLMDAFVIVFDKSGVTKLKEHTQNERSSGAYAYPVESILDPTTGKLYDPHGPPRPTPTATDPDPLSSVPSVFAIRRFMLTRSLRIQLYRFFFERLKQDKRVAHLWLVVDFEDPQREEKEMVRVPYVLHAGVCTPHPEWSNPYGEADLAIFHWKAIVRSPAWTQMIGGNGVPPFPPPSPYETIMATKDQDIYVLCWLDAHRHQGDVYTNIYNPTRKAALHCNMKMAWAMFSSMPGFAEALFVLLALTGTDFTYKWWIFGSSNEEALEMAVMQYVGIDRHDIWSFEHPHRFSSFLEYLANEHRSGRHPSAKAPILNTNPQEQNWILAQWLHFLCYWTTLEWTGVTGVTGVTSSPQSLLPLSKLFQESTLQTIRTWRPYFLCGLEGSGVKGPPDFFMRKPMKKVKAKATPAPIKGGIRKPTLPIQTLFKRKIGAIGGKPIVPSRRLLEEGDDPRCAPSRVPSPKPAKRFRLALEDPDPMPVLEEASPLPDIFG